MSDLAWQTNMRCAIFRNLRDRDAVVRRHFPKELRLVKPSLRNEARMGPRMKSLESAPGTLGHTEMQLRSLPQLRSRFGGCASSNGIASCIGLPGGPPK